jgi:hypothetical protein
LNVLNRKRKRERKREREKKKEKASERESGGRGGGWGRAGGNKSAIQDRFTRINATGAYLTLSLLSLSLCSLSPSLSLPDCCRLRYAKHITLTSGISAAPKTAVDVCPGRKPAFSVFKRPARPYKNVIQKRFT